MNQYTTGETAALLVVFLLQWLKRSKLVPWVGQQTSGLNVAISSFMAFLTSLGLTITFDGSLVEGGQIVITYGAIGTMLTHWGSQMFHQELLYQVGRKVDVIKTDKTEAAGTASAGA